MVRPNRRERRAENRGTVVAVMLLTVAVVSFALGYMAGRGRAPEPETPLAVSSAPRQPIAQAEPAQPQAQPAATTAAPAAGAKPEGENLTFFDTLPKGEQPPLGSGINMPPADAAPAPAAASSAQPAQVATAPAPAPTAAPAPPPKPAPAKTSSAKTDTGPFILQISSSRNPDEAGVLLGKLEKKGYQCSIQQADLGAKGVWYRVFVGPAATRADADSLARRIKSDMKIDPLIRRQ